jgi:hypothetical protein
MNSPFKNLLVGQNYKGFQKQSKDELDMIDDELNLEKIPSSLSEVYHEFDE